MFGIDKIRSVIARTIFDYLHEPIFISFLSETILWLIIYQIDKIIAQDELLIYTSS